MTLTTRLNKLMMMDFDEQFMAQILRVALRASRRGKDNTFSGSRFATEQHRSIQHRVVAHPEDAVCGVCVRMYSIPSTIDKRHGPRTVISRQRTTNERRNGPRLHEACLRGGAAGLHCTVLPARHDSQALLAAANNWGAMHRDHGGNRIATVRRYVTLHFNWCLFVPRLLYSIVVSSVRLEQSINQFEQ